MLALQLAAAHRRGTNVMSLKRKNERREVGGREGQQYTG